MLLLLRIPLPPDYFTRDRPEFTVPEEVHDSEQNAYLVDGQQSPTFRYSITCKKYSQIVGICPSGPVVCNISGCKEAIWEAYSRVFFTTSCRLICSTGSVRLLVQCEIYLKLLGPTGKGKPMLYCQMLTPLLCVSCTSDRKDRICIRGNIDFSIAENLDEWVIYI